MEAFVRHDQLLHPCSEELGTDLGSLLPSRSPEEVTSLSLDHAHIGHRSRREGPSTFRTTLLVVLIAMSSFAGALVFPLSDLGRATPTSVSREWLFHLAGWWILLVAWAMLYAGVLSRP